MTHGFDDRGRQYDKDGNLQDWWMAEDASRFTTLADALADQFDKVEVAPGVFANGRFTLGENIADQGGLRVALTAYLDSMKDKELKDIDGFTPLRRFLSGLCKFMGRKYPSGRDSFSHKNRSSFSRRKQS